MNPKRCPERVEGKIPSRAIEGENGKGKVDDGAQLPFSILPLTRSPCGGIIIVQLMKGGWAR